MSRNKLRKKNKRQNQYLKLEEKRFNHFVFFWQYILDKRPNFCLLCGKYISIGILLLVKKMKGENYIHNVCARQFITYNMVNERLNEESLLICDYEPIQIVPRYNPSPLLMFGTKVCRAKIKNTEADLLAHLVKTHNFVMEDFKDFKKLRFTYFLRPTGIPFPKVRDY